jgi:hypothetical protein
MKVKPPEIWSPLVNFESPVAAGGPAAVAGRDSIRIRSAGISRQWLEELKRLGDAEGIDESRLDKMQRILQEGRLDEFLPQTVEGMLEESEWLESWSG